MVSNTKSSTRVALSAYFSIFPNFGPRGPLYSICKVNDGQKKKKKDICKDFAEGISGIRILEGNTVQKSSVGAIKRDCSGLKYIEQD
jgi:hypothetical protein